MGSGGIVFGVFQCWASSLPNTIPPCASAAAAVASINISQHLQLAPTVVMPVVRPQRSSVSPRKGLGKAEKGWAK